MITNPRLARTALLIATVVWAGSIAHAQDDFEKVQPAAPQPEDRDRGIPFESCAFGDSKSAAEARVRFETELSLYLDHIDRVCSLTEVQKEKLELVGRLEISRHLAQAAELQGHYKAIRLAAASEPPNPKRYQAVLSDLAKLPLAGEQGSFLYSSMLYKVCKTALSPKQFALFRADRRAARESTHRAMINSVVLLIDSVAKVDHDQRVKLTEVISDATRNDRRMGGSLADHMLTLAATVRISDAKIKPLLSAEQWQKVGSHLAILGRLIDSDWQSLGSLPPDPDLDDPPPVANHAQP